MPSSSRDAELILRARDLASKPFQDIAKAVDSFTAALAGNVEAAKHGEITYAELSESQRDLERAQKALVKQQNDVSGYTAQTAKAAEQAEKVKALQARYDELNKKVQAGVTLKRAEQNAYDGLTGKITLAQTALKKQTDALDKQAAALKAVGIDVAQLGDANDALTATITQVSLAIGESGEALNAYNRNLQVFKQEQRDAAEATAANVEMLKAEKIALEQAAVAANEKWIAENRNFSPVVQRNEARTTNTALPQYGSSRSAEDAARDFRAAILDQEFAQEKALEAQKAATVETEKQAAADAEVLRLKQEQAAEEERILLLKAEQSRLRALDRDAEARESYEAQQKARQQLANFQQLAARSQAAASRSAPGAPRAPELSSNVSGQIQSIASPAAAARTTLAGLEDQTKQLAAAFVFANEPVKNFSESFKKFSDINKAALAQAGAIDAYRDQAAVLATAKTRYDAAAASADKYRLAVQSAIAPDEELAESLARADRELLAAARSVETETEALVQLDAALKSAGISSTNLAADQERLLAVSRAATTAQNALTEQHRKYGDAVEESGKKVSLFGAGQRESLSLTQRWRGEVLEQIAAFVGLMAAIEGAHKALEAYVTAQAVENKLMVVTVGDAKQAAELYNYVHDQSVRLGIGFKDLSASYSSFAIAAKNAGLTLDGTNFIFERLTEAMRVNHASSDQVANSYLELEHMLSRNKVEMMDLNRLAANVPGIEAAMASGIGMSMAQMYAEMKKGAISSQVAVTAAATVIREQYEKQIPSAIRSLQAEEGRFETSLFDFNKRIAEGGFAQAWTELLQTMTAFFNSPDGERWRGIITNAFVAVTNVLELFVKNIDAISAAMTLLFGVKFAKWVLGTVAQMVQLRLAAVEAAAAMAASAQTVTAAETEQTAAMWRLNASWAEYNGLTVVAASRAAAAGTALKGAAASGALLATALSGLNAVMIAGIAVIGAYAVGDWIHKQADEGSTAAGVLDTAFTVMGLNIALIIDNLQKTFNDFSLTGFVQRFKDGIAAVNGVASDMKSRIGTGVDLGTGLTAAQQADKDAADAHNKRVQDQYDAAIKAGDHPEKPDLVTPESIRADKDIEAAIASFKKFIDQQEAVRKKAVADAEGDAAKMAAAMAKLYATQPKAAQAEADRIKAANPFAFANASTASRSEFNSQVEGGVKGLSNPALADAKDPLAEQRDNAARALADELAEMHSVYEAAQKTSVDDQVKSIEDKYVALFNRLEVFKSKLGGSSVTIDGKQVSTAALEKEITATKELMETDARRKAMEADISGLQGERAARLSTIDEQLKAGQITAQQAYDQQVLALDEVNARLQVAAQRAKDYAAALYKVNPSQENAEFVANANKAVIESGAGTGGNSSVLVKQALTDDTSGLTNVTSEVDARKQMIDQIKALEEQGAITGEEAQARVKAAYAETSAKIKEQASALQQLLDLQLKDGTITQENYDKLTTQLQTITTESDATKSLAVEINKTFNEDLVSGATNAFDSIGKNIGGLITHTESWRQSIHGIESAFADMAASVLEDIAKIILKQQLLQMFGLDEKGNGGGTGGVGGFVSSLFGGGGDLSSSDARLNGGGGASGGGFLSSLFGGGGGFLSGLFGGGGADPLASGPSSILSAADAGAGLPGDAAASGAADSLSSLLPDLSAFAFHSGGVVGQGGMRRSADSSWFANAPRMHSGGVAGLKSDEVPAILQRGEKVTAKNVPDKGAQRTPQIAIRNILVDDTAGIHAAMASSEGEKIVLTHIKRNAGTVRSVVGGG
jgi:tape measure domain-containing protein